MNEQTKGSAGVGIAIYGAGGFAREVAWLAEQCLVDGAVPKVICFIDDSEFSPGRILNDIPVLNLNETLRSFPEALIVGGIGDPGTRAAVTRRAGEAGFRFGTLIHRDVSKSKWVETGEGTVICAGSIITTNVRIGRHVQINLNCTIGHDCVLGDFATLAPGVHVSGCVHIGAGAYIGTGAVIINGTIDSPLIVGEGAVVGAAACVTKSVPASTTVVGVPAREMVHRDSGSHKS